MKIIIIYLSSFFERSILVLSFLVLITWTFEIYGQEEVPQYGFEADLVLGVNFSQLDGDGISGFNKAGIRAGMDIGYPLSRTKGWSVGIYYDQRGSSTRLIRTNTFDQFISLHYFSLPLSFHTKSWWYDNIDRYKIKTYVSLIPARLFASSSNNPSFDNERDAFEKWDFSFLLGIHYAVSRRGSIGLSGERSILKIFNIPNSDENGLQSYQLNLSYAYSLR